MVAGKKWMLRCWDANSDVFESNFFSFDYRENGDSVYYP